MDKVTSGGMLNVKNMQYISGYMKKIIYHW